MRKENAVSANDGKFNGRITRARAATVHASGQLLSQKAPNQPDQKRILRANAKRAALDENNTNAGVQCKKRSVLQDITNVCCNKSYKKCFNATQIQAKSSKQARKGNAKASKVTPSVAVEVQPTQPNLQKDDIQKIGKIEPEEVTYSVNGKGDETVPLNRIKEENVKYDWPANESTAIPSQPQSPSRVDVMVSIPGTSMTSNDPDFINIDSEKEDPLLCSLYAPEIYNNLRVAELVRRPCANFMETIQRDITQSMREILVDWLVEVSEEYKLVPDTLYLTVYLIDWFLSQNLIERHRLQLLGITCMLIASKYEEICAPRVEEFCFITDNTYTREEVLKMESKVLRYFGFQLFAPTAKTFLRRFLRAAQASYTSPSLELEYLANYLVELTLVDYGFLNFLPSIIAASAVFLARWTLDQSSHPWNPTLEHYTAYSTSDLQTTVLALQDLQLNTSGCPLNAIRMKYRQQKFKLVATFSSPKLLETLF